MKKYYIGIALIVILLLQGCKMIQIESLWKDREITIDGNDKDWVDAKYYLKDLNIVLGVMNDADFLYLCFYPTTQELTMQLIKQGCTLWINTEGKKKKEIGIHFPLGMTNQKIFETKESTKPENIEKMLLSIPRDLEIIGPTKKEVQKLRLNDLIGLEIGINAHKGLFAYELKIPLRNDSENSFFLDVEPDSEILLGLETPKITQPKMPTKMSGLKGDMSDKRPGGDRRKMPGGDSQHEIGKKPKSLNAWMKVLLVSE